MRCGRRRRAGPCTKWLQVRLEALPLRRGAAGARNAGADAPRNGGRVEVGALGEEGKGGDAGDVICFLDADDVMLDNHLSVHWWRPRAGAPRCARPCARVPCVLLRQGR